MMLASVDLFPNAGVWGGGGSSHLPKQGFFPKRSLPPVVTSRSRGPRAPYEESSSAALRWRLGGGQRARVAGGPRRGPSRHLHQLKNELRADERRIEVDQRSSFDKSGRSMQA